MTEATPKIVKVTELALEEKAPPSEEDYDFLERHQEEENNTKAKNDKASGAKKQA